MTPRLLTALAEDFTEVLAIDASAAMLEPVRRATVKLDNITVLQAELGTIAERPFDLIVAAMVLHHQPSPQRFFAEARGRLQQGGQLLIVELDRHQHDWTRETCGDLWLGFTANELDQWAERVGLVLAGRQFLAQRNGFSIQLAGYTLNPNQTT